jgi:Amidohydrolase family
MPWKSGCPCCNSNPTLNRRQLVASAAAFSAAAVAGVSFEPVVAKAQTRPVAGEPPRTRDLILRGGHVVTVDPKLGDPPAADVHVRDGAIAAIGPSLDAPGAEVVDAQGMIVMPGFIETHSHCWNALLKNLRRPGVEYFALKDTFGKHHTPVDYYRANRLFMTEAINAGITTVLNFAHNTQSPAHVDAEIRAMMESGLRGRYAYSGPDPYPGDKMLDTDDVLRVKRSFFDRPGLIDLGYGMRPSPVRGKPIAVYPQEFRWAQEQGLPIILHSGSRPGLMTPAQLHAEGFSKNMIFVHCCSSTRGTVRSWWRTEHQTHSRSITICAIRLASNCATNWSTWSGSKSTSASRMMRPRSIQRRCSIRCDLPSTSALRCPTPLSPICG